ncbi:MAG: hypothetical protein ACOCP8_02955 [archaeon]
MKKPIFVNSPEKFFDIYGYPYIEKSPLEEAILNGILQEIINSDTPLGSLVLTGRALYSYIQKYKYVSELPLYKFKLDKNLKDIEYKIKIIKRDDNNET